MPKTVRTISCCYCDASTMVDLARVGRGVLTCDACGARLSSARMEAVVNKPVPVRHDATRRVCGGWGVGTHGGRLDPRWHGKVGAVAGADAVAGGAAGIARPKKKAKARPKKRKSFLDRLEDMWDEIEDIGDDIKDLWD